MIYKSIAEIERRIPIFPLPRALLLPRGTLPLTLFEPRYLKMADDALKNGARLIGMIQPKENEALYEVGCAGRITSWRETERGPLLVSLTGVCRFRVEKEMETTTPYRQILADYAPYSTDLEKERGAGEVNRDRLLEALRRYLKRHELRADWGAIEQTPNEMLVTTLSVISPFGAREKQALLEAETLAKRSEILVALTEMALATSNGENSLQ